jgi:transketolase
MNVGELEKKANEIRQDVIKMLHEAGSGHSAGSLDQADLFTALYFEILKHDPSNPMWEDRDRLFLSCGHTVPVRYVAMAHAGYFPLSDLKTLRKLGSNLQGHPERIKMPALESTSGPLGEGLAQASGYAYAARFDQKNFRIYCITSDGEHDCGGHWEAVMFAAKNKLANLTAFVDRNNIQIDGFTEDVMPLDPLTEKYRAFNWNVIEIDGNNIEEIINAVNQAKSVNDKPTVIICHTIPGKGVSFMENLPEWHGKAPNEEETKRALRELSGAS